jgi:peroxiredoxin
LRDRYDEIQGEGAEVVVIGTGNATLARYFVEDEKIPFPVLLDDAAVAAQAAEVRRVWFAELFHPASYAGTHRAWQAGHRIGIPGKRTNQLGATFVIGPGDRLRYEHRDAHTADHAPSSEVIAAVQAGGDTHE